MLVVPNGVTLKGEGLESKGRNRARKPRLQRQARDYKVEIAGSMCGPGCRRSGPPTTALLEEISPKILQKNMKWILVLAFGILALGFIVLYRAQPAAAVPSDRREAPKGTNERGRR